MISWVFSQAQVPPHGGHRQPFLRRAVGRIVAASAILAKVAAGIETQEAVPPGLGRAGCIGVEYRLLLQPPDHVRQVALEVSVDIAARQDPAAMIDQKLGGRRQIRAGALSGQLGHRSAPVVPDLPQIAAADVEVRVAVLSGHDEHPPGVFPQLAGDADACRRLQNPAPDIVVFPLPMTRAVDRHEDLVATDRFQPIQGFQVEIVPIVLKLKVAFGRSGRANAIRSSSTSVAARGSL